MSKQFVTQIKDDTDAPYLGMYEGEETVHDFANLDSAVEFVTIHAKTRNLQLIPQFQCLRYVGLSVIDEEVIGLLAQLPNLQVMQISNNRQERLPALKSLAALKYLIVYNAKKIQSLDFLNDMEQLESLFLSELLKLEDIHALSSLKNLKELVLEGNLHGQGSVLPDVSALFALKKLEYLKFFSKKTVFNAADFSAFTRLKYLSISPSRYPFEFYAELERYLPEQVQTRHDMFFPYERDACTTCGSTHFIEAVGARQRMFCPSCHQKKLDKLLSTYETLSGKPALHAIAHIPFLNQN